MQNQIENDHGWLSLLNDEKNHFLIPYLSIRNLFLINVLKNKIAHLREFLTSQFFKKAEKHLSLEFNSKSAKKAIEFYFLKKKTPNDMFYQKITHSVLTVVDKLLKNL